MRYMERANHVLSCVNEYMLLDVQISMHYDIALLALKEVLHSKYPKSTFLRSNQIQSVYTKTCGLITDFDCPQEPVKLLHDAYETLDSVTNGNPETELPKHLTYTYNCALFVYRACQTYLNNKR